MKQRPAFTKAEPSGRTGSDLSALLHRISHRPERQPAAGFPIGDIGEVWSARARLLVFDQGGSVPRRIRSW